MKRTTIARKRKPRLRGAAARTIDRGTVRAVVKGYLAAFMNLPVGRIADAGILGDEYITFLTAINRELGNPADDFVGLSAGSTVSEVIAFFSRHAAAR